MRSPWLITKHPREQLANMKNAGNQRINETHLSMQHLRPSLPIIQGYEALHDNMILEPEKIMVFWDWDADNYICIDIFLITINLYIVHIRVWLTIAVFIILLNREVYNNKPSYKWKIVPTTGIETTFVFFFFHRGSNFLSKLCIHQFGNGA